jgi:molybdenum cofactor biosynthesis enzyme MoaA
MYCRAEKGVTLLWGLRSPCNLNCLYCYFGTLGGGPQDRSAGPSRPGELSHVGSTDLSLIEMLQFISTFTPELVHRVFIAGGEPLHSVC